MASNIFTSAPRISGPDPMGFGEVQSPSSVWSLGKGPMWMAQKSHGYRMLNHVKSFFGPVRSPVFWLFKHLTSSWTMFQHIWQKVQQVAVFVAQDPDGCRFKSTSSFFVPRRFSPYVSISLRILTFIISLKVQISYFCWIQILCLLFLSTVFPHFSDGFWLSHNNNSPNPSR